MTGPQPELGSALKKPHLDARGECAQAPVPVRCHWDRGLRNGELYEEPVSGRVYEPSGLSVAVSSGAVPRVAASRRSATGSPRAKAARKSP